MTILTSLTNRIFLASATLAVLAIAASVYFVSLTTTREAEAELQRGLIEAGTLVDQQCAELVQTLTVMARLVADSPRLKAAIDTGDPPTVQPLARDYQQQVSAAMLVLTGRNGEILAEAGAVDVASGAIGAKTEIQQALGGSETHGFWPLDDGVLQVTTVPITIGLDRPEIMGTLTVGSRLDNALAEQFKRATESDIVFVVGGRVRASTLPAGDQERLGSLAEGDQVRTIALANGEYVALTRPLFPAAISMSAAGAPKVLLLRSRTERLRFLDAIHTGLGVVAMIAVLAATIVSYAVARTITRPLATITGVMREMSATGDLTRKISVSRDATWDDEDATLLATTFNTLTDSIARFQREAAQRERLSALGRLSTVIAHEIRNPLMIIKGSLRALSNERVSREDIKQVLADVDEEVARLNRVVNDVLDFARPIHFNYTQTDLNALCANAVGATRTEHAEMTVSIEPDPTLASIETDAERLRTALVNLLANARHAVAARTGARGDGPDIELGTADLGATVRITIRDRGVGVNPDDLPRIFDPYFTTKRTGSGLGLAIARNIIEGMKGSISFKSEVGVGTEISIQLPKRPEDPEESSPSLRMATTEPGTTLTPVDSEPRQTRQRGASA